MIEGPPKKEKGRNTRRVNRSMRRAARLKTRVRELIVGTFIVRTLAFNGKNGVGHAEEIRQVPAEELWYCRITGGQTGRPKQLHSSGVRRILQWIWWRCDGRQG